MEEERERKEESDIEEGVSMGSIARGQRKVRLHWEETQPREKKGASSFRCSCK